MLARKYITIITRLLLQHCGGFHFVPAVFSHTGPFHESIKRLIAGQIRHKLILSEGHAKQSRVRSKVNYEIVDKMRLYGDC